MDRTEVMQRLRAERDQLRERFGVESLMLFGSVARNDAGPDSDVDLLADFSRPISLFDLVAAQEYLEQRLGVNHVDLVPRNSLYPALSQDVLRDAVHVE